MGKTKNIGGKNCLFSKCGSFALNSKIKKLIEKMLVKRIKVYKWSDRIKKKKISNRVNKVIKTREVFFSKFAKSKCGSFRKNRKRVRCNFKNTFN